MSISVIREKYIAPVREITDPKALKASIAQLSSKLKKFNTSLAMNEVKDYKIQCKELYTDLKSIKQIVKSSGVEEAVLNKYLERVKNIKLAIVDSHSKNIEAISSDSEEEYSFDGNMEQMSDDDQLPNEKNMEQHSSDSEEGPIQKPINVDLPAAELDAFNQQVQETEAAPKNMDSSLKFLNMMNHLITLMQGLKEAPMTITFPEEEKRNCNVVCHASVENRNSEGDVLALNFVKYGKISIISRLDAIQIEYANNWEKNTQIEFLAKLANITLKMHSNYRTTQRQIPGFIEKYASKLQLKTLYEGFTIGRYVRSCGLFGASIRLEEVRCQGVDFYVWARRIPAFEKDFSQSAIAQQVNVKSSVMMSAPETIVLNIQSKEANNSRMADKKIGIRFDAEGNVHTIYLDSEYPTLDELMNQAHLVIKNLKEIIQTMS